MEKAKEGYRHLRKGFKIYSQEAERDSETPIDQYGLPRTVIGNLRVDPQHIRILFRAHGSRTMHHLIENDFTQHTLIHSELSLYKAERTEPFEKDSGQWTYPDKMTIDFVFKGRIPGRGEERARIEVPVEELEEDVARYINRIYTHLGALLLIAGFALQALAASPLL